MGGGLAPSDPLHLSLFGAVALRGADGREIAVSSRRARALLAILSLAAGEPMDRDMISRLLWPGRFAAHAKASLRQCVLDLGKLLLPLGNDVIVATRNTLGLNGGAAHSDLGRLERALLHGEYRHAADQLAGIGGAQLLDQMDFGEAFDDWLARQRCAVEQRLQAAVEAGLAVLERAGRTDEHARLRRAWLARNPAAFERATADVHITHSQRIRIAVLPFRSPEGELAHDYFADGIVDELITALGKVPQLTVAGRTSSFHFRGSDQVLPEIASALRVSHLIEGSVFRQGEQVRIHVHLIDGNTGFESWANRYDGTLDNIFAVQENVAQAVTAALSRALGLDVEQPTSRAMTDSKAAYDLYLQGRALMTRMFAEGMLPRAINLLEQAVGLDPRFVEAWVALAEAHQLVSIYTPCLDRIAESEKMAECARRAHSIEPNCAEAYSLLGVHHWTRNDIVGALDLAFKAYRMEPDNPAVGMRLGSFLLYCGRTAQAMNYVEAAIDRDPADGRKYALLVNGRLNQGDIAGAIIAGQRMVDLGWPPLWLAVALAANGDFDSAVATYRDGRLSVGTVMSSPAGTTALSPEAADAYWTMAANGVCSGKADDREHYCKVLDMHFATLHDPSDPLIVLPAIFMGYADMLFKAVGTSITPANTLCLQSIWSPIDPICRIWQHDEFIPFAQRIGMAAAWDKYGWPDLLPVPSNRVA
jgi:TolB-like protein/DNA-binding SARP family transcriptional activator